jgi:hypothetical protein
MSKFDGILKAAKEREDSKSESAASEEVPAAPAPKKQGRPKGKRSSPDYEQVTAYIKKETYRQVRIALLQQSEFQDFSELVEQLLGEFLRT